MEKWRRVSEISQCHLIDSNREVYEESKVTKKKEEYSFTINNKTGIRCKTLSVRSKW